MQRFHGWVCWELGFVRNGVLNRRAQGADRYAERWIMPSERRFFSQLF